MGTRGTIGFYKNGKGKITYNHFDSYPEGIGKDILEEIRGVPIEKLNEIFDGIKLIKNEDKKPTKEEIKKYQKYSNASVGGQGTGNKEVITYYQLLRNLQGTLKPYIEGKVKLLIDNENFLKDSLFCEWSYIINLDENVLEVWQGFQTKNQNNRYKFTQEEIKKEKKIESGHEPYYNCALIKTYPLDNLPSERTFLEDLEEDEE